LREVEALAAGAGAKAAAEATREAKRANFIVFITVVREMKGRNRVRKDGKECYEPCGSVSSRGKRLKYAQNSNKCMFLGSQLERISWW
jgi:hypothetical protein